MNEVERTSPLRSARRLGMVLPALLLIPTLEDDLAELGIDVFEFGGSVIRKIALLAERNGFNLGFPNERLLEWVDALINAYGTRTRPHHTPRRYTQAETTKGERELSIENEVFYGKPASSYAA